MIKHNQEGAVSFAVVAILSVLFVAALVFGIWAFSSRQDYKNNVDAKIAVAVQAEKQTEATAAQAQFAQEEKSPLQTYNGPQAYGSIVLKYPKTYSSYVNNESANTSGNNIVLDGYFSPGVLATIGGQNSIYALRMQVLNQSYSTTVQSLQSNQQNGGPQLSFQAYSLPSLPKVVGVEVTGTQAYDGDASTSDTMVVLPVRTQTIVLWTEGPNYLSDFNNFVLPNFSFSP